MLLESDDFGKALKRKGYMEDEINMCISETSTEKQKIEAVTAFVKGKIKWNEKSTLFAEDVKKAWKEGQGSSAEINLALITALRTAGLSAEPVALSTRKNGVLNPVHPTVTDFNYVIARVVADADTFLIDATEPLAAPGLLPVRCLNGKGRLISEPSGNWVAITPRADTKHTASYKINITPDGNIEGESSHSREGYEALDIRKQIKASSSVDDYYTLRQKKTEGLTFNSHLLTGVDTLTLPVKESLTFTLNDAIDLNSDLILINPLLFEATTSNPFKLKERKYPVEFPYPFNETLLFTWTIPDGYSVETLPKPAIVALPDKEGRFTYNVIQSGNTITVLSMINLNQTLFLPDEYEFIKAFFSQIIAKQSENIVLKRI